MVLLKNNTGFPVQLPFKIGEEIHLVPGQKVKLSAEEYARIKEEHPLVLKGLLVFNLERAPASPPKAHKTPKAQKAPAENKKSVKKSASTAKAKSEEDVADVKPEAPEE